MENNTFKLTGKLVERKINEDETSGSVKIAVRSQYPNSEGLHFENTFLVFIGYVAAFAKRIKLGAEVEIEGRIAIEGSNKFVLIGDKFKAKSEDLENPTETIQCTASI